MSKDNKICIVGWHYFPEVYKHFENNFLSSSYIVAHCYNKLLDNTKLEYSVIKNIGLEFGCYDYYIKNIWDKKSNVLFMHDDMKIFDRKVIKDIFKKCRGYDYVYVLSKSRDKKQGKSYRCFYLSIKIINLLLKDFNGIWYDGYNKGYALNKKHIYDSRYTEKYYRSCDGVGKQLKRTLIYLREKYNLKWNRIPFDDIYFFRRGIIDKFEAKFLSDNTIFNKNEVNKMEKIASKYKDKRSRKYHYYTKWYDFYFNSIKMNNLNILEIGINNELDLKIWKKYFKNSTVYGVFSKEKIDEEVKDGFDIIIDNGKSKDDRLENFKNLFKKMNPWGIYVLENLHKDYKNNKIIINFLKDRIDDVNFNGKFKTNNLENNINEKSLKKYEKNISAINFHHGICFVFKSFG